MPQSGLQAIAGAGDTLRFNLCVSLLSDIRRPLHLFLDVITAFSVLAMEIKSMVPGTSSSPVPCPSLEPDQRQFSYLSIELLLYQVLPEHFKSQK